MRSRESGVGSSGTDQRREGGGVRVVPAAVLLVIVAVVVVPAMTLAYAGVGGAVAGGVLVVIAAVVVGDAVAGRRSLRHVRVSGPELVRLWKDRADVFEINFHCDDRRGRTLRIGPDLPDEIVSQTVDKFVALPGGSEHSKVEWNCTPRKRGRYFLNRCAVENPSPFRLWNARALLPLETEIRVYPNLASEQKNAPDLFLRRPQMGLRLHRQVGKGREFEKLREYVAGDGFDEIDWKATARRGHPITRVFQVERTQEVYIVLDSSRLTARPMADGAGSILERNITASLLLALAAEKRGDLFGLVTFSDRVHGFVRARSGKAHYGACREALYTLEPRIVTPDFDEVCTMLRLKLRRRALIVFLTELDDPVLSESFIRNVNLVRRQHLVLAAIARPAGAQPLFLGTPPESADDVYRDLAGHLQWNKLRELGKQLEHLGVRFTMLDPGKAGVQLTSLYADIKQRQLL
jgi:uncharacterized protein (DUF58 family)